MPKPYLVQCNCDILVEKSIVYICNFLNSGSSCKCDTFSPIVTNENTLCQHQTTKDFNSIQFNYFFNNTKIGCNFG